MGRTSIVFVSGEGIGATAVALLDDDGFCNRN